MNPDAGSAWRRQSDLYLCDLSPLGSMTTSTGETPFGPGLPPTKAATRFPAQGCRGRLPRLSCCTAIFFVSNAGVTPAAAFPLGPGSHIWDGSCFVFHCWAEAVFGVEAVWVIANGGFIFVILQQILLIDLAYWPILQIR